MPARCRDVAENKTGRPRPTATGLINTVEFVLSVHGFFQRFARFKFGVIARRDVDGFAGTRVAAGCRFTLQNREGADAYETNFVTPAKEKPRRSGG